MKKESVMCWSCIRGDGKLSVGDVSRFAGGDQNGDMSTNHPSPWQPCPDQN